MISSWLARRLSGFREAVLEEWQACKSDPSVKAVVVAFVAVFVGFPIALGGYRFNHHSPAQHLEELEESSDAIAEAARLATQSLDESREQMTRNVLGTAHDRFSCDVSTTNEPIVTFDGQFWWRDDGRCAAQLDNMREQKQKAIDNMREQKQKAIDEGAKLSSYFETTIRVDTDMDSSWLNHEERTCRTYPDNAGRVSAVACNASGTHRDHNIPVTFWGGVERGITSDWRCTRNKTLLNDEFICRAID